MPAPFRIHLTVTRWDATARATPGVRHRLRALGVRVRQAGRVELRGRPCSGQDCGSMSLPEHT